MENVLEQNRHVFEFCIAEKGLANSWVVIAADSTIWWRGVGVANAGKSTHGTTDAISRLEYMWALDIAVAGVATSSNDIRSIQSH